MDENLNQEQSQDTNQDQSILSQANQEQEQPKVELKIEDYKVEREDNEKYWDDWKADESNMDFLNKAHGAGITNEQLDFLLKEYDSRAIDLVSNSSQMDTQTVVSDLQKEWGGDYQTNINNAFRAAQASGLTPEQINDPSIGNNVAFIKMASYFGGQMGEAKGVTNATPIKEDIGSLMRSEAYSNPRHPEHNATVERINQAYKNGFKL